MTGSIISPVAFSSLFKYSWQLKAVHNSGFGGKPNPTHLVSPRNGHQKYLPPKLEAATGH